MLPEQTSILIVGAGPTGLAAAISLFNQGCKDIVIVDAATRTPDTSRAMAIHAATLEVCDLSSVSYDELDSFLYDRHSIQSVAQTSSLN
jgi:2-polyprenyl-6-methoxyphenol hydroxylase-like FAD-dependent oxidoreductase